MGQTLVIVPCGRAKIWSKLPAIGPVEARDAYIGSPFKVNHAYAERFADQWRILSAKYGFIAPDFVIPESYDACFKFPRTAPISWERLREQVELQHLDQFDPIIVLGGKENQAAARAAFADCLERLHMPFAGLPLGKALQATKRAVAAGTALPAGD